MFNWINKFRKVFVAQYCSQRGNLLFNREAFVAYTNNVVYSEQMALGPLHSVNITNQIISIGRHNYINPEILAFADRINNEQLDRWAARKSHHE